MDVGEPAAGFHITVPRIAIGWNKIQTPAA
jgi:hypothetical protein